MVQTPIDTSADNALFAIFDHAQGLQRRVYRIRSRSTFNKHGVEEMRQQAQGLLNEIKELASLAEPEPTP
jgi:glucose-6-phosphate isomerase